MNPPMVSIQVAWRLCWQSIESWLLYSECVLFQRAQEEAFALTKKKISLKRQLAPCKSPFQFSSVRACLIRSIGRAIGFAMCSLISTNLTGRQAPMLCKCQPELLYLRDIDQRVVSMTTAEP